MSISYVVEDLHCIVFNIYAPNLAQERIAFFTKLNSIFEQVNHESDIIACGDFNCVLNKSIDRRPRQEHEDGGNRELISIIVKTLHLKTYGGLKIQIPSDIRSIEETQSRV